MSDLPKATKQGPDKRWWEFYFVRYFVGSVIGMGVMVFLNTAETSPLKERIFSGLVNPQEAGASYVVLMAALGLAYCYIASAPILVMHMARASLRYDRAIGVHWADALAGLVAAGLGLWMFCGLQRTALWSWQFWALSLAALVFGFQATLLSGVLRTKFRTVYQFYETLSRARAEESTIRSEYIESYRHLREHGNSFSIVFLELSLAITLSAVTDLGVLLLLVVIWIAPACGAWLVGSYLESRLADVPIR